MLRESFINHSTHNENLVFTKKDSVIVLLKMGPEPYKDWTAYKTPLFLRQTTFYCDQRR